MKKVLVTGHKGYIGAHLVDLLKRQGHFVVGCDLNLFAGCEFDAITNPDVDLNKDFRALEPYELDGIDCIMHLAAISNDPMGDLNPQVTYKINREGTIDLARKAKKAKVPLFLFASSCSIYGKGATLDIDESGETTPLTPYAISKIAAEEALKELSDNHFKTVSLRNATAYGYSPMLRIDLVVNNLLACAMTRGDIRMMSDGTPWRPLIHCRDIARAFTAFLATPPKTECLIVNVGGNQENYQVKDVASLVQMKVPDTQVVFTGEVGADPRNYRVKFDLLKEVLPHFSLEYTLEAGIDQLHAHYLEKRFSLEDFEGNRYVRLRTLKQRLEKLEYAVS
ncbi:MAG: NAD-dependent epimerase/dehydratase family protein [Parachlamydiaceae bacterium]